MPDTPRFEDYHRTVIGYHGTKRSVALSIVQGETGFAWSENKTDWLGHGVYFWEYAPQQAWRWADHLRQKRNWGEEVAVVGSMIRLASCFDLLDPYNVECLEDLYAQYEADVQLTGAHPKRNYNHRKHLDCAVFQFAYASLESVGQPVDTCRAVYVPTGSGSRVWKRSWLTKEAHIQICVRNEACILGTWLVKPTEEVEDV